MKSRLDSIIFTRGLIKTPDPTLPIWIDLYKTKDGLLTLTIDKAKHLVVFTKFKGPGLDQRWVKSVTFEMVEYSTIDPLLIVMEELDEVAAETPPEIRG